MIFFMIAGFTLYESGSVRNKHSSFVLIKNLIVVSIASIAWWLTGSGFAYGEATHFIGNNPWYFAGAGYEKVKEDNYLKYVL